jgi:hypothetical protein
LKPSRSCSTKPDLGSASTRNLAPELAHAVSPSFYESHTSSFEGTARSPVEVGPRETSGCSPAFFGCPIGQRAGSARRRRRVREDQLVRGGLGRRARPEQPRPSPSSASDGYTARVRSAAVFPSASAPSTRARSASCSMRHRKTSRRAWAWRRKGVMTAGA